MWAFMGASFALLMVAVLPACLPLQKCDRCAALCYLRYATCVTAWLCWWLQVARWVLLLCYANQTLRDGWAGSGSLSEKPHKSRH